MQQLRRSGPHRRVQHIQTGQPNRKREQGSIDRREESGLARLGISACMRVNLALSIRTIPLTICSLVSQSWTTLITAFRDASSSSPDADAIPTCTDVSVLLPRLRLPGVGSVRTTLFLLSTAQTATTYP